MARIASLDASFDLEVAVGQLKDVTVMITAAGNVFMPGTTACLINNGERKLRLVGVDMNNDPSILQMCDAFYPVPRGNDPGYIDALLQICKKEHVDVILPIMSVELGALAKNRDRFEAIGTRVAVSDVEALEVANDKIKLFQYMRAHGIPCAEYSTVYCLDDLRSAVTALGYPNKRVCIKTTNGSGSRGFRIMDEVKSRFDMYMNEKPNSSYIRLCEMERILGETDEFPELMVMEYLPGNEYTIDLLADRGDVLYSCCRKSQRMENGIMLNSVVVENSDASEICRRITEGLRLDGNIGFDILEREDGTPIVAECNPRITAGIPVFRLAGVNLPYLNVKRLLGEALPKCELRIGTIVTRRWMEMAV